MFSTHSSAKENFDSKAKSIISLIKNHPKDKKSIKIKKNEIFIAATITDKDITGPVREAETGYNGKINGRFFHIDKTRYGLIDSDYKELVKLAESIQRTKNFREKVSQEFIEESLFLWIENCIKKDLNNSYIETLIEKAKEAVKPITIYIPIANMVIESPFEFCGALIRNFDKIKIDEMEDRSYSLIDESSKGNVEIFFSDLRKEYQGYACIELKLECEESYAGKLSFDKANQISELLGIYSDAVLLPDIKCLSKAKGIEENFSFTTISTNEEGHTNQNSKLIDFASFHTWYITKQKLNNYIEHGLNVISDITLSNNPSKFENSILNMATLYSKSAFTSNPLEKLVYMLSSLEATLLKNGNEPIQQNVSERMAILIYQNLDERKKAIKNFKNVYSLRSKYLHHGHSTNEIEDLSYFFFNVWLFYINLIKNSKNFLDKQDFLNAIDDLKLG